jgi:hypothetical protein
MQIIVKQFLVMMPRFFLGGRGVVTIMMKALPSHPHVDNHTLMKINHWNNMIT